MQTLFYTETEAFFGPKIVRTYYFDNHVTATAELWQLDVPEDSEMYETCKGYEHAWDIHIDVPTECEDVSIQTDVGMVLVDEGKGDGGPEINETIEEMIVGYYEMWMAS